MSTRYENGSLYRNHQRAAELHDQAAHYHRRAAARHGKCDRETRHEDSRQALEHSHEAYLHTYQVHQRTTNEHSVADPGHEDMATLAHELWRARGYPEGSLEQDWFYAAEDLQSQNRSQPPTVTRFTADGAYAASSLVRADSDFFLPASLNDVHGAPLLRAGINNFRNLWVTAVETSAKVRSSGFAVLAVLHEGRVYLSTRGVWHWQPATPLGTTWIGSKRAPTLSPTEDIEIAPVFSARRDSLATINGFDLADFDLADMTRTEAREYLDLSGTIGAQPTVILSQSGRLKEHLAAIKCY